MILRILGHGSSAEPPTAMRQTLVDRHVGLGMRVGMLQPDALTQATRKQPSRGVQLDRSLFPDTRPTKGVGRTSKTLRHARRFRPGLRA